MDSIGAEDDSEEGGGGASFTASSQTPLRESSNEEATSDTRGSSEGVNLFPRGTSDGQMLSQYISDENTPSTPQVPPRGTGGGYNPANMQSPFSQR